MRLKVFKKFLRPELFLVLLLLVLSAFLRFKNLGYSDYIGDEHKAFIELDRGQSFYDFFISRRKGPMQFLVAYIPYLFTHNYRNELAERIPFTIISVGAVLVFYLLVKKLTKDTTTAFFAAFFFMVNGFIVGFSRIAQYQNLNLFFSFLSLYFYSDLLDKKNHLFRRTLLGTLFWCLSFFSHWDAIFILPLVVWLFVKFFLNKSFSKEYKIRVVIYNFVLGCLILLPFMIPYSFHQKSSDKNLDYLFRRLGVGYSNNDTYRILIELYNPFVTFWLLLILGLIGVMVYDKSYMFTLWFLFSYGVFEAFVRKPGTHIYNFLIPVFILCGVALSLLLKKARIFLKCLLILLLLVVCGFLYYQSWFIFIDHEREYPWEQKQVLTINLKCEVGDRLCYRIQTYVIWKSTKYCYDCTGQKLPLFGFPHKRYWNDIDSFINEQNTINGENLGYSTNEDKTVSEWYVDVPYKTAGDFYFVGVRKPGNFVEDMNPPYPRAGNPVKIFKSKDGTNQVKIYRIILPKKQGLPVVTR